MVGQARPTVAAARCRLPSTQAGRRALFYRPATADPAVVTLDDNLRDLYTIGDLVTYLKELTLPSSRGYNGAVLVVNGDADQLMCGTAPPNGAPCTSGPALAEYETQFYGPHATVDAAIVPDTGHDLALSTTAPATTGHIIDWLRSALR